MNNYIFENGWDITGFSSEAEALKSAEYHWDRLTEAEKLTTNYFMIYEISIDMDEAEGDYRDYLVRNIKNWKDMQSYMVCNDNGDIACHDASLWYAEIILSEMIAEHPDEGWELIEQGVYDD